MPKYVAFLRAINVGGHTVKMDTLRGFFETLGFSNVETFIASGNVIFDATSESVKSLENRIETELYKSLGYKVTTFIRSTSEVAEIVQANPFPAPELDVQSPGLYIAFLADNPSDEAKQKLLAFATELDQFYVNGREIYWLCHTRMSDSAFSGALLEKTLGMQATLRNVTTLIKIASKYGR
jgi:uncharacterized protein (DUF1697 family)